MRPHLASRANLATLVELFREHTRETAVVSYRGNRRYATTYGELASLTGRFAAELDRRGVAPGERVVLWGANSAEWIAVFFGCLLRGVIAVPLDAAGMPEFATRVITDVSPKLIVGDASLLRSFIAGGAAQIAFAELSAMLPTTPLYTISDAVNEHTPFQIVFTSGTTSEPRGIVHTHRNVLVTLAPIESEIDKYRRYERIFHPLRFLHSLPLSHVFGQFMGLWIPAILAAEVHFAEQLEPARVTELIRRERISVLIAVPRVLGLVRAHLLARFPKLAQEIEGSPGWSVRKRWWRFRRVHRALGWKFWAVISGGATLAPELESFWNRLGFALIQGYGLTETAALVTLNHPFSIKQGSIGKPLPGREVRISEEGEILVRGAMLSTATWQSGAMRARDGEWLATGDLAQQSPTGELRFLGRKGDVIVTANGMNIYPADLEAAILREPGVRACAVVPCEAARGPEPVAVVLAASSAEDADRELQDAVANANHSLAEYQQIRRVLRWPELQFPYTSTGKLLRRQVAEWACAALAGRQQAVGVAGPNILLDLIAEITGEPAPSPAAAGEVNPPDSLRLSEDLHLDSLGRVQLQSALEQKLGIELEDDVLAGLATLGELRATIEQSLGPALNMKSSQEGGEDQAIDPLVALSRKDASVEAHETNDHLYPHWPWSLLVRTARIVFIEAIMRPLVWLLGAPHVLRDTQSLPAGPMLLIANHVTAYDGALILYALPPRLRHNVAIAMSGEMLLDLRHGRNQGSAILDLFAPLGYWLVTACFNVFPLPRARGFRRSFAHAGEAMDRGYSVLIFPEGTRTKTTQMNPFRPGIGLLAAESAVPVLPIALVGLAELRASGRGWFRSGKLTVHVGRPIPTDAGVDPAQITASLEQAVHLLL